MEGVGSWVAVSILVHPTGVHWGSVIYFFFFTKKSSSTPDRKSFVLGSHIVTLEQKTSLPKLLPQSAEHTVIQMLLCVHYDLFLLNSLEPIKSKGVSTYSTFGHVVCVC